MKVSINRTEKPKETNYVIIYINEERYVLQEDNQGIAIYKTSDTGYDIIHIQPKAANSIQIF